MRTNDRMETHATLWPALLLAVSLGTWLTGCSGETPGFLSAQGKSTPYILKEDCTFTIVEELSRAGITSPEITGASDVTATMSISLGEKSITVADCRITENSHSLPIYVP